MTVSQFRSMIWAHYRAHPRPMPWRRVRDRRDPYRILVSEIMLQQTQVARVAGFYEKFIKRFPDFRALARAKTGDVLRVWQGLGYNRRALALQKLAKKVVEEYGGSLPRDRESLERLPGVGPYTAGAVRAFAFNEPEVFIETNIRRVFIHFFFPAASGNAKHERNVTDAALRRYIERTLDAKNPREWYWALMDYGALCGTFEENPNRRSAHYVRQPRFSGSDRELRGKVLRVLLAKKGVSEPVLGRLLGEPAGRVSKVVSGLRKDGFVAVSRKRIELVK